MERHVGSYLKQVYPDLQIYFPDGLYQISENSFGWFGIEGMEEGKADGNIAAPRALAEMQKIHDYIDNVLLQEKIRPENLIIAGFSQGGTMAFYAALQRQECIGGVLTISGGALDQVKQINSRPKVMLLAGSNEYSHYSGQEHATKVHYLLESYGYNTQLYLTPDNRHDIDVQSLAKLAEFIQLCIDKKKSDLKPDNGLRL